MTTLRDRIEGMIWGQFVGDAAALGAHWIYDQEELNQAFPVGILGFEPPGPAHYHAGKHPGDQTHYGDSALLLLESLAERGGLDLADFARRFRAFYESPSCRSYKDHATRGVLENLALNPGNLLQSGIDDDQPATVTRLAPLVAVTGAENTPVEALTRFNQNSNRAVAYAQAHAEILEALLHAASLEAAFDNVTQTEPLEKIVAARAARDESVLEATLLFGQSCPLAKSFPAAVHAAIRGEEDFAQAILETIRAGGDNAARAALVGSWLGALHGIDSIPEDWRLRLSSRERIAAAIDRLTALQSSNATA